MSSKDISYKFSGFEVSLGLAVIALFMWHSPIVLPFKLITVFFHELSHGLAAILTGGSIAGISINSMQGGCCLTVGGWRWLILSAGYLGSLLWGIGILLASKKKGINRALTQSLGILLLIVAAIWIRDLEALLLTIFIGAGLIFISSKLKESYCTIFIRFLSLLSCFYVVYDIKDDLLSRSIIDSDASQLAKIIFPRFMWPAGGWIIGAIWMAIALFLLYKVFKQTFARESGY